MPSGKIEVKCPTCGETRMARPDRRLKSENCKPCVARSRAYERMQGDYARVRHPHFRRWRGMMDRCHNEKHKHHHGYGARGIFVCESWHDFWAFARWCDDTHVAGHSLERRDNDGPYSPDNCEWATPTQQARNRRNTTLVTHDGRTLRLDQWADATGIPAVVLKERLKKCGWPPEKALETPYKPRLAQMGV